MNNDILVKIGADITDFSRKLDQTTQQLAGIGKTTKKSSKFAAVKMGAIGLAAYGVTKAVKTVTGALGGAIDRYDTLNAFPRVLESMGFDAKDSKKAIDKLAKGIDGLPTPLDSVAKSAQGIALITGDLEGATDTTIALNNAFLASSASTADAERGTRQYVQMLSKGKVDMQSWNSLVETMPVALTKVAESFGYAGESAKNDLYDALKSGDITFSDFNSKLVELNDGVGGFAEMALENSKGIGTSWQNIKTAITSGLTSIIEAIDKALGGSGEIEEALDKIKVGVQATFDWIAEAIPVIAEVFTVLYDAFATLIEWVRSFRDSNAESFDGVYEKITSIFTQIVEYLQGAWETIQEFWAEHGEAILENTEKVFNMMVDTVANSYEAILDIIETIMKKVVPYLEEQLKKVQKFWEENGENIMKAVENAFKFIQGVIDTVMPIVAVIIEGAWILISNTFSTFIGIVMGLVKSFSGLLSGDFEAMGEGINDIWLAMWDGIKGVVSGAWGMMSEAFGGLWSDISGWFTGLKDDAFKWGINMIGGFIDGIKQKGKDVSNAVSGVIDKAKGFIGFNSPSKKGEGRYITHWGRNMISGFVDGINKEKNAPANAVAKMMAGLKHEVADVGTINMSYATPSGTSATLSRSISESIEFNNASSNASIVAELRDQTRLLRNNSNMTVELDGREVGRTFTPHIDHRRALRDMGRFF